MVPPRVRLAAARAVALAATVVVFWLGTTRGALLPSVHFELWDKLEHALGFGVLTLLYAGAFPVRGKLRGPVLAAILVGGLLELVQATLPFRRADLWDWVADAVGALLCGGALLWRHSSRGGAPAAPAPRAS